MEWELIVVLLCLVFSFLFSASETVLTSLGRLEIQRIRSKSEKNYKLVEAWVKFPNRYLTAVLVGNNIANICASALFTLWLNKHFPMHVGISIAVFTVVIIIFIEIIPKIIARQLALKVAPVTIRFLNFVSILLKPLIFVVYRFSVGIVGMSGRPGRAKPISEEELTHTIKMATKEGGIDRETGEALENLIDFPDTRARDIMRPRKQVKSLSVQFSRQEVLTFISEFRFSRYPVVRGGLDQVVGILFVKDLLASMARGSKATWTQVVRPATFVSEMTDLGSILRDMKRRGSHMFLVRNETGVITGIITLEDLLEEIVGEIRDEDDHPSEAGRESAMGAPNIVSGDLPIVDFNENYENQLPVDIGYSTLNGYIIHRCGGTLPEEGTLIVDDELSFRVKSINKEGVATLEIIEHVGSDNILT